MITVTDIFAGAGGSSTGAIQVPDVEVVLAANHWQLAVDVHNSNHPTTVHACVDLHMEDPRRFPKTDILWASPECTKWSPASGKAKALSAEMGGDPTLFDDVPDELMTSDEDEITRSRLLMFDVLRFVEYHRYRALIIENVVDIATQPKYAIAWEAWKRGLRKLGYWFRIVSLNSMHATALGMPAPQSRDRLYIVAWPEKEKAPDIDAVLRPRGYCVHCDAIVECAQSWKAGRTVGRYRAQYIYVCTRCWRPTEPAWLPASAAIDWTIPGQRIGDRKTPLSDKTMARIREGLRRYGHEFIVERRGEYRVRSTEHPLSTLTANETTKSLVLEAAGNTYDAADPRHPRHGDPDSYYRIWPTEEPLRGLHGTASKALLVPTEGRDGKRAQVTGQPLRTQTTRNELGLLVPSGGTWHETAYTTDDALRTVTTRENHGIVTMLRGANAPKSTSDPLDTIAASGNHHGLIVSYYSRDDATRPADKPLGTVTTEPRHGLLVPYYAASDTAKPTTLPVGTLPTRDHYALIMRNNTPRGNPAQMVTPAHEPFRTMTAVGAGQSVLEPTTIDPDDCTFRMLEPHEIAAGMSFPADYLWAGTKRDRVRMAGNAVTPPAARDLVWAVAASLERAS